MKTTETAEGITKQSGTNASTYRTRARIHEAFLELAETTDFADITINLLTKSAGLNRTTFYLHYSSLDDLAEVIIEEIIDHLAEGGRLIASGIGTDSPGSHDSYFHTISERPALFHRLLTKPGSSPLSGRLIAMHVHSIRAIWMHYGHDLSIDPESWDLRARYAAGGVYGVTVQWLESGMQERIESICDRVLEMTLLCAGAQRSIEAKD